MFDLNDLPSHAHGKNSTNRVYFRDLPAGKRADYTFRPELEHQANLIAEAEKNRGLSRLAPSPTWERGILIRTGHWLVALGRRMEGYGKHGTALAASEQSGC